MSHPRNADGIFGGSNREGGSDRHLKSDADIFTEFFGSGSNPLVGASGSAGSGEGGSGRHPRNEADVFTEFFGDFNSKPFVEGARKAAPIEKMLTCSLEDLYKGTTKKMKISREIAGVYGKTMQVEEILTIDVKPGWKKGTKITFSEKGNEQDGVIPDLVFIIDEKTHPVFTREGNDLIVTQNISVLEAFTEYTVRLTTLDGRRLTIPVNNVIHPEYEEVVAKEGMPLQKDQTQKGNLRIKFNIKFPTRLTSEQKTGLKKVLG